MKNFQTNYTHKKYIEYLYIHHLDLTNVNICYNISHIFLDI